MTTLTSRAILLTAFAAGTAAAQVTPPTGATPPAGSTPPAGATPPASRETPLPPPPAIGPPIRRIATATAVSTERLGSINSVLQLADGRVLVNDGSRRRLIILDTMLAMSGVVLDSLAEIANTYGTRAGTIFAYRGDSVVFIDQASYAMLFFDSKMNMARVRAVPRAQEIYNFTSTFQGLPGFDARGRLVYRTYATPAPPKVAPPAGVPFYPQDPDSAFIVALDLDSRKLDTLGSIRQLGSRMNPRQTAEGHFTFYSSMHPLPLVDDWAVTPDGRVAFLRGRDYRIDWVNADGSRSSSEKVPYDWQRLVDEEKKRIVDSVKSVQQRSAINSWVASMIRWANTYAKPYPATFKVPEGYVLQPGMPRDWILPPGVSFPQNYMFACPPGVEPTGPVNVTGTLGAAPPVAGAGTAGAGGAGGGTAAGLPAAPRCLPAPPAIGGGVAPPPPTMREVFVVDADELPDYRPPFTTGAARADGDGNLWVRAVTAKPILGGPVYDIISPEGKLVDRLQIPTGYTLVGFGRGRVVYLSVRDATGLHLARVRLR